MRKRVEDIDLNYLHETTDAQIWAKAFMKVLRDHNLKPDEDLMIGWFANAMAAVDMKYAAEQARENGFLPPITDEAKWE